MINKTAESTNYQFECLIEEQLNPNSYLSTFVELNVWLKIHNQIDVIVHEKLINNNPEGVMIPFSQLSEYLISKKTNRNISEKIEQNLKIWK